MGEEIVENIARIRLLHPVYLDVPMMISFLASLRDGVVFEDTTTRSDTQSTTRDREGGAKIRLPGLGSLLGFDASGRMGRSEKGETSQEVKAVRQHTEASLFNALHAALHEEDMVKRVGRATDLSGISPGDVVEISGEFVGNPLEPVVEFFRQAVPYFDMTDESEPVDPAAIEAAASVAADAKAEADELDKRAARAERSGSPATKADAVGLRQQAKDARSRSDGHVALVSAALEEAAKRNQQRLGIRLLGQVGQDLAETRVQDTVINGADFKAVLTMSAEFFTDATRAHLRAGVFSSIGKVTRVLGEADDVNLLRRTVLGAAGADVGRELLTSAEQEGGLQLEIFDPIIKAPAIQVLPLAVFV